MAKRKLRLGVLASGGGTNLQALIDSCREQRIDAEIAVVLSNNPEAGALARAQKAGLVQACINHRDFAHREDFDRALVAALQEAEVDLVVLAGFMRLISEVFLQAFPHRVINIHPALLPAFPGLNVQRKALEYGARFAGCTVHFVDSGMDTGPIIIQAVVPVMADDTEESLSARILEQEHRIYPQAIQLIADNRVSVEGRRVLIKDYQAEATALINPPA